MATLLYTESYTKYNTPPDTCIPSYGLTAAQVTGVRNGAVADGDNSFRQLGKLRFVLGPDLYVFDRVRPSSVW